MKNKSWMLLPAILGFALVGCQTTKEEPKVEQQVEYATVIGMVSYRERIALPEDAVITVKLEDISLADAPSVVIAETEFESQGFQSPFAFQIDYDPSQIIENHRYTISARIEVNGKLRFISDTIYPVLTDESKTDNANLRLVGVSSN